MSAAPYGFREKRKARVGGFGSGKWRRRNKKPTVEETVGRLDVAELRAEGALPPGASWLGCGQEEVSVEWTPCTLGGYQPWLLCPLCERRCRTLYLVSCYGCRDCHGLAYASQRRDAATRRERRLMKLRTRLELPPTLLLPIEMFGCCRPEGMHSATFARLFREAEALEAEVMDDVQRSIEDAEAKLLLVAARLRRSARDSDPRVTP